MNAVNTFNGLNGKIVSREELVSIIELAKKQEQPEVIDRLQLVLDQYDFDQFEIDLNRPAVECVPASLLPLLDEAPELPEEDHGLGKAVSPDDIYQYITDLMLNTIKVANKLPWQTMWEESSLGNGKQATNYESKKAYRGINFFLLNFELKFDKEKGFYMDWKNWENPYFLTFNQVEKYGGKIKEGTKAYRVVYFTRLYKFEAELEDGKKIEFGTYDQKKWIAWLKENKSVVEKTTGTPIEVIAADYIPILKYYNVFNGGDVEGIDFKEPPANPNASKSENEKIEVAEAIVKSYPNPPDVKMVGNQPAYYPKSDRILMTPIEQFKNPQFFYSVFFHELTHSTGHSKRLDRGNDTRKRDGSKADKKAYDFEELVAEMGAVFLCAESGILFQTRDQSAVYLRHYLQKLTDRMEEDNRFFFRAASASQAAADHILNRDKEGNPAYLKTLKVDTSGKAAKKVDTSKVKKAKTTTKPEIVGYSLVDNINGDVIASKKTLPDLKKTYDSLETKEPFKGMSPIVYEIIKKGGKNVQGERVKVDWNNAKPKKTKSELEAANPKGFAKKPKSVAVNTAIKDVLSLPKFKNVVKNNTQATILYKHFKETPNLETEIEIESPFEDGILKAGSSLFYYSPFDNWSGTGLLELTGLGVDFVNAVNGRRESLHKQKHNLALFDGLKAPRKSKDLTECEKKLPGYKIVKKKSKTASDKKDFVVNIPIDSILYDFDEANQDKVKELVKSGIKNIAPLHVYQDKKDNKIYLVKGRDELEAFIKLNEENVPVVFSKVAPKETKSKVKGLKGRIPFFNTRIEAKKYFLNWARKNLKGKKVHHKELGKDVLFSMSGIEHSISKGLTIPKAALILQAEEMLKNSKYLLSEPDKLGRKQIVAVHKMAATGIVEGEETEVLLTLREGANGVIYYDHEIDGIKKLPSTSVGLKSPTVKRSKEVSSAKAQRKDTKKSNSTKKGLKSPAAIEAQKEPIIPLQPEPQPPAQQDRGGQVVPEAPVKKKVRNMAVKPSAGNSQFYTVAGEVGKFLQLVERKPKESVVITLDGEQGAGKTTTLYQFMDAFAKEGNRGIFFSLEEHHESVLAQDKADRYLSPESQKMIDIVSEIDNQEDFYNMVASYDIIFLDSWQKLQRMIGAIRLDEDLRKKFDGKVFVIIFQQTTTGRTKGGSEVVFDGDIIIKMVKEATFNENYAYFDKNRYTKTPLENLRYNIAGAYVYNPNETHEEPETSLPVEVEEMQGFSITEIA